MASLRELARERFRARLLGGPGRSASAFGIVLGINAYHGDAAACLIVDGKLVAAAEEERFRRIKHWAGFPTEAVRSCLRAAGLTLGEVTDVAVNSDSRAQLGRKAAFLLSHRPSVHFLHERLRSRRHRASLRARLQAVQPGCGFRGRIHRVEHHLAHLASAYLASPYENAVVVSVDGFGDFASAAWGVGEGSTLSRLGRIYFPHSLGIFYQALTQYLGFHRYGDEYKVMGLAPYGQPRHRDALRRLVRLQSDGGFELQLQYFRHHRESIEYQWENGTPAVGCLYSDALVDLLGPVRAPAGPLEQRHRDIAHSAQAVFEEALFHLLERLHQQHGSPRLALAGGCAMNSVANGKICQRTAFRDLYVQPAAGDAGGALGAAYVVAASSGTARAGLAMTHAFWGPEFSDETVEQTLRGTAMPDDAGPVRVRRVGDADELCEIVAERVAAGCVVGWFQGRMEWGPRALGNRSIVADPRRHDMKEVLNAKIKHRESFRPFAPSILREHVAEWFEEDRDVPCMTEVYRVREAKRALIPAVTHVDGTGRLQTVDEKTNPLYHRLISRFHAITGVPAVLNTSFNENEPIVCRPEEAIECFLRTKMDTLVLGGFVVERRAG